MAMAAGQSGETDGSIYNAATVGDFTSLLRRAFSLITELKDEAEHSATGFEQQFSALRVELRMAQITSQPVGGGNSRDDKFELVDVQTMRPVIFNGFKAENFKAWAKRVNSFTNGKLNGFRSALEAAEKLGKYTAVDIDLMQSWDWISAVVADSKLHDMLLMITAGEAQGIVESVPEQGSEAWRLLSVRYN